MNARKVAAQFAAHVWFEETQTVQRTAQEKARFARKNWQSFLAVAPEGLGRLLIKIERGRANRERNQRSEALVSVE